jgi:lipopolysaccharide biosynthesis protein
MDHIISSDTISGLSRNWSFYPSPVNHWQRRRHFETFFNNAQRRPTWHSIKPLKSRDKWIVYFIFAPNCILQSTHKFTLSRLRDLGIPLLVVCATPSPNKIPKGLANYCDALIWKDLPGYDFSAYSIALNRIGQISAGADVFVMNDSVFGPFSDLRPMLANAPWDLTGFTASGQDGNHIQSYAFLLKRVDFIRMARLTTVFFPYVSFSQKNSVISLQETRFARVAARSMSVGSYWFADINQVVNPSLERAIELLNSGFPFLKRSLVSESTPLAERACAIEALQRYNHPLV